MNGKTEKAPLPDRDIKRLRRWVWIVLIGAIVTGTLGGLNRLYKRYNPDPYYVQAEKVADDPMAVTRHVRINGVDLRIPVAYFKSSIPQEVEQRDVLLITLYPDFEPLKERPRALARRGEWYRNVMILIGDPVGRKTAEEIFASRTRAYDATEFAGIEHGLHHYTQPPHVRNDSGDLWVEVVGENVSSLIRCSKPHSDISRPQCMHYEWVSDFWLNISYDKRLLPHWREIRDQVFLLTENFGRQAQSIDSTSNINKKEN